MTRTNLLSLHPLNAIDASPSELIEIAGVLGVDLVCLFTHVPPAAAGRYPMVAAADIPDIRHALAQAGVRLCNLEVFPLDRDGDEARFTEALETGTALGATRATAHIHEIDGERQATDRFAAFADLAARHGIVAGLEFNAFSAVRDIAAAARIVRAAGQGSLLLDTLHLVRGGGGAADVAAASDLIDYAQLSDGPAAMPADERWREAIVERQLPGDGDFPLSDIIRALRPDTIFEVEVPQGAARKAGVPPLERARRAVDAMRRTLAAATNEVTS